MRSPRPMRWCSWWSRGSDVNARLKLPENQRFEIVGFLALLGRILWFDPRREYSSIPTANSRSRRAQGLSRLAASSRPPGGLGLDWPEHGGILDRIGAGGAHHIIGKFKPLVLGEIHAAGDSVMYILSTGCQWRYIPKDFPPRSTLHDYFTWWICDGTLDRIHYALYVECREKAEREASPTACIIDSQSVKSAEKGGPALILMGSMQAN